MTEDRSMVKRGLVVSSCAVLAAGLLIVSPPYADAACPRKKAARLVSELQTVPIEQHRFEWRVLDGTLNFDSDEDLIIEFATIPFSPSPATTSIWMNKQGGGTFFVVNFQNGTANPGGLAYDEDEWNNVRAVLDFGSQTYRVSINGQTTTPLDFIGMEDATSATGPFIGLGNWTSSEAPDPAWLDSMRIRRRSPEGIETLFTAQFDGDPDFDPFVGSMDFMSPETRELAGNSCLTTTTLNVDTTANSIVARGRVTPAHPDDRVTVDLFKKKGDNFVKVDTNQPNLNDNSRYSTSFDRPGNTNRCRIRTTFKFDFDHLGSRAQETFNC